LTEVKAAPSLKDHMAMFPTRRRKRKSRRCGTGWGHQVSGISSHLCQRALQKLPNPSLSWTFFLMKRKLLTQVLPWSYLG